MDHQPEMELFGTAGSKDGEDIALQNPSIQSNTDIDIAEDARSDQDTATTHPPQLVQAFATPQQSAKHEKRDSKNEIPSTVANDAPVSQDQYGHPTVVRNESPTKSTAIGEAERAPEADAIARSQPDRGSDEANARSQDPANGQLEDEQDSAEAAVSQTQLSHPTDTTLEYQEDMQTESESSKPTSMSPPSAPASLLHNLRASTAAKAAPNKLITDPFICSRLAFATVTLFRMGKAKECKAISQFAIDLMGEEAWHDEWLPMYLDAERKEGDGEAVMDLLGDVVAVLRLTDGAQAAFLGILMGFVV